MSEPISNNINSESNQVNGEQKKMLLNVRTGDSLSRREKENLSSNTGYAPAMKSPTAREQKMVPERVMNLEIAIKE